jgi:predicted membrane-bound dolichyl-phosphate-mannose-protein mannosyltransferase
MPQASELDRKNLPFCRADWAILLLLLSLFLLTRLPRLGFPAGYLLDEEYYVPAARTYLSPTALDQNIVHPPLAKMIIALFIALAGDNPIGWRIGAVLFGWMTVVLAYLLGRALFNSRVAGGFAGALIVADFLHLVMCRMATLDIFVSFFILGGLYFSYLDAVREDDRVIHAHSILGAVFLGLALSCKLSGLGGILATAAFYALYFLTGGQKVPLKKWVLLVLLYAGVITAVYAAAHVPLFQKGVPLSRLAYRETMELHYQMEFKHPQLSGMLQWITLQRPFWYYWVNDQQARTLTGIAGMGNFIFWWGFLGLFLRRAFLAIGSRKPGALLLLSGYLSLYLFWLTSFQVRGGHFHFKGGFFYYMLPCVPLMALTVAEVMADAWKHPAGRVSVVAYWGGLLYFSLRFSPLLYGLTRSYAYFDALFGMSIDWLIFVAIFLNLQLFAWKLIPLYRGWRPVNS